VYDKTSGQKWMLCHGRQHQDIGQTDANWLSAPEAADSLPGISIRKLRDKTSAAPSPQQMLPMGVSRSRCMAYQDQMVQKVTIPQNRRQTAAGIDIKR
jgi:hypothetical protein